MDKAFLSGQYLNERAERHYPLNFARVDLADFRGLGQLIYDIYRFL